MKKSTAIILAAGCGSRMKNKKNKLYIDLLGRPVITYPLDAFEESDVTQIILVVAAGDEDYVREEIVSRYGYSKVTRIISGGSLRCLSVYEGLKAIDDTEYVLIHDGARAFITKDLVNLCLQEVEKYKACIAGVPAKDTIRIVDNEDVAVDTPPRRHMWQVQTPQCFVYSEICDAFSAMEAAGDYSVTDDGMVMEIYGNRKIKMIRGSYENIKITTRDDIVTGKAILNARMAKEKE